MEIGAVILAGGKSRRMGRDKAELMFGNVSFLEKLIQEFSGFPELLVSAAEKKDRPDLDCFVVEDVYQDCGPMGGLHAALSVCRSKAMLAVPCDVPLFSRELAEEMCRACTGEVDAVIAVSKEGRAHPLCGVYRKSCLPVLEQCLKEGNYRMQELFSRLHVKFYPAGALSWQLQNVNTPEEYEKLQNVNIPEEYEKLQNDSAREEYEKLQNNSAREEYEKPKTRNVLAVSGLKNAGKTTLIERLIPKLIEGGLCVAVIKHDGHRFAPDVPGTDSSRFFQAGASTSIVYDGEKYALARREEVSAEELFGLAPEADLILLEGGKESGYPKIEVVGEHPKEPPIAGLKGRLAYVCARTGDSSSKKRPEGNVTEDGAFRMGVSSFGGRETEAEALVFDGEGLEAGVPVFDREEIETLAVWIRKWYEEGRLKERWESD